MTRVDLLPNAPNSDYWSDPPRQTSLFENANWARARCWPVAEGLKRQFAEPVETQLDARPCRLGLGLIRYEK